MPHYSLFLLCGLPVWMFFATSLQSSSRSLLDNANLIRKMRFPRQLVPLSVVATQLVSFARDARDRARAEPRLVPEARDTVWLAIPLAALFVCLVAGLALAVASLERALPRRRAHRRGAAPALVLPDADALLARRAARASATTHGSCDLIHWGNSADAGDRGAPRAALLRRSRRRAADVVYLVVAAVVALALGAFVFTPRRRPDRGRSLITAVEDRRLVRRRS